MGFPHLCEQTSQSQVLPSHIQPQHCLSNPQKGQAEVRFCSSLPTRQSLFCDLNEINCTIILPRTVILFTHPSSKRLHLLSSCGALEGRDFWAMRGLFFMQILDDPSQIREGGVSVFSIEQLYFKTYLEKHLLIHFILPCEVLSDWSCKGRKWEAPQNRCLWGMGQDKACCPQTVADHLCSGATAHLSQLWEWLGKPQPLHM